MNHLFKRFRRDIIGILWLATGIFLALTLYSYRPTDPSLNSIGSGLIARNYCGFFGSFTADLLYQFLGMGAWVLVFSTIRLAIRGFLGKELQLGRTRILWSVLLVVTACSLSALYFPQTKFFEQQILVGGLLGHVVVTSLVSVFNFAGVAVILWALAAVLMVFYTEKPIRELLALPLSILRSTYEGLRERVDVSAMTEAVVKFKVLFSWPQAILATVPAIPAMREAKEKVIREPKSGSRFFPIKPDSSFEAEEELEDEDGDVEAEHDESGEEFEEDEEECEEGEEEELPAQKTLFKMPSRKAKAKKSATRKVSLKKKVERRIAHWELPKISILDDPPLIRAKVDDKEIKQKAALLVNKLEQFSVRGKVVGVRPGPAVTLFEFKPNVDVKISKITELADDLSLALSSESVRIIAPIPGRDVVGIETSNSVRETVYLKDIVADEEFWSDDIALPLALGREANGDPKVVDLRKMPHLLVAGSTGSGKSVFTVSSITGLLFRHSPKTLKLILVDPKQVDLAAFNEIPHLLMPPIREPKKALSALRWAIREMEKRYRSMSKFGARGLESFNETVEDLSKKKTEEHAAINEELEGARSNECYYYTSQPFIVIVVEEFGDLMAVDKANVEQAVVRLAQMARACGIHLVLAMQSPRKDVVTGLIKTNIPGRASFKVASKMDSRIILDEAGAERLLTRGDMLFLAPGVSKPSRHHGPWLSDKEINRVMTFWRDQGDPEYDDLAMKALDGSGGGFDLNGDTAGEEDEYDDRYDEILAYVSTQKAVSASLLQRKFRLGYPRAARLIEVMETEGAIGPPQGSKPRQVLISELK